MTFLRPYLSASTPETGLAIRANRLVHDVIILLSAVVRGRCDRSVPMLINVAEMTPVLATPGCQSMELHASNTKFHSLIAKE